MSEYRDIQAERAAKNRPGAQFVADNTDVGGYWMVPPPPVVGPAAPVAPPMAAPPPPPDHSMDIFGRAQGAIAGQQSDALRAIQMALGRQGLIGGSVDTEAKQGVVETGAQAAQGAQEFAQANSTNAAAAAPIGDLFQAILARFQPAPTSVGPPSGAPLAPTPRPGGQAVV